jgi:type I site-specific restriction endonuclease
VYEYSLAQALTDGLYVKNPTIATRKDFNPQGRSEEEIENLFQKNFDMQKEIQILLVPPNVG